jgi:hypothetical protein
VARRRRRGSPWRLVKQMQRPRFGGGALAGWC